MKTKQLPKGWREVELREITESISAGGTPRRDKKEYWENGTIPWVKISDMKEKYISKTEEKITDKGLKNSSANFFPSGTLIYSIFASLGTIGILEIDATTNQAIAGIIPKKDIISTKYLYYCLQAEKNKILSKKSHATQDNLNLTILRSHKIPLPPLQIQKAIVSILGKAETLKQKREESDKLTKDYLQSVFYEMFYNKGFEEVELGSIARLTMGGTPSTSKIEYWDNGKVNWMKSGDIKRDFIYSIPNRITELGLKNSNAEMYPTGTVVIALNGQGRTRGTTAILNIETSSNQSVCGIIPNHVKISSIYLHFNLKFRYQELRNITGDNDRSGLNLTILRGLSISLPPIELQQKFASIVEEVEKLKEKQKQSKEELNVMFDSLMKQAFNGELVQ